jgi:photosystem I subunit 3
MINCKAKSTTVTSNGFIKASKGLTISTIAIIISMSNIEPTKADISGLTLCGFSKAFAKRKNQEIKELQKRMKKYDAESSPTVALKATIERTEKRFDFYAKSGLLCGTDGLPHLIADPGFALKNGHAGDVLIPTFGFLYFAGLIGHSGRLYLEATLAKEKEIIIDVPLAFSCIGKAVGWPVLVVGELNNGTLLEKDSNHDKLK